MNIQNLILNFKQKKTIKKVKLQPAFIRQLISPQTRNQRSNQRSNSKKSRDSEKVFFKKRKKNQIKFNIRDSKIRVLSPKDDVSIYRLKTDCGLFSPKIRRMNKTILASESTYSDRQLTTWLDKLDNKVKVAKASHFNGFKSPVIFRDTIFKNKRESHNIVRKCNLLLSNDQINFDFDPEISNY